MTDKEERTVGHGAAPENQSSQDVGYGKPPKHSQFKKGQSGNAKGRPKGARNFRTEVDAVLRSKVTVIHNGKPRSVGTTKAALMRLKEKALKGDLRAITQILVLAQDASDSAGAHLRERHLSKLEKDILGRFALPGENDEPNRSTNE